ncbi:MAG: sugar phosphate isomerase/epimerase [Anaerolineales bacterium]|nr:sugar phosphate isomerase/epimerase [Anaerolineales bacterium]
MPRLAGIELVKNRIHLAEQLGGDAVVMHVYPPTVQPKLSGFNDFLFDQIRRSLDDLEVYARECGVRIALENLIDFAAVEAGVTDMAHAGDNADLLARLLAAYAPEFLGFCFDSGHAVLGFDRTARYAPLFDRLAVLHLHDNDGVNDLHLPVGDGVVNWADVAALVVASPYTKPLSFELSIRHTRFTEAAPFLAYSMAGCRRFAEQVARLRTQAQT